MTELVNIFILDFMLGFDNLDEETRAKKLESLREGLFDDFQVTIELPKDLDDYKFDTVEDYLTYITELTPPFERSMDKQTVKVSKARQVLMDYYLMKMHFRIDLKKSAIKKIENEGIVIIDEIDKIVHSSDVTTIATIDNFYEKIDKKEGR